MAAHSSDSGFPEHRAFRRKIADRSAAFDGALILAATIFLEGESPMLSFAVKLGDGVVVAVTLERR